VRTKLQVPADISDETLQRQALADDKICQLMAGNMPKKVIVVPKKLVNIVL
jgi:leucyl-tRNA synthetase